MLASLTRHNYVWSDEQSRSYGKGLGPAVRRRTMGGSRQSTFRLRHSRVLCLYSAEAGTIKGLRHDTCAFVASPVFQSPFYAYSVFFLSSPRLGLRSHTVLGHCLSLTFFACLSSYFIFLAHRPENNVFSFLCVLFYAQRSILINAVVSSDVFYGLNAARVLSVVALLLAFASSIVTVVSDIRAVNKAQRDSNSDDRACGYIGCVCDF